MAGLEPDATGNPLKQNNDGAVGLALFVLKAVLGGGEDESEGQEPAEESMVMSPDYLGDDEGGEEPALRAEHFEEELARLEAEIDKDRGPRHLKQLKRLRGVWPKDPRTNRLLGLAFMQKRYWQDGLKYLRKAIALDSNLRGDSQIIKAAISSLSSQSKPGLGLRFLVRDIGEAAIPALKETSAAGGEWQKENANRALRDLGVGN